MNSKFKNFFEWNQQIGNFSYIFLEVTKFLNYEMAKYQNNYDGKR